LGDGGQRGREATRGRGRAGSGVLVVAVVVAFGSPFGSIFGASAVAFAQKPALGAAPPAVAPPPPPAAPPVPPPAPPPPPPAPVAPAPDLPLVGPAPAPTPAPAPASVVAPVPTADETPAASDHDAVVGHVGVEVRRIDTAPFPLTLHTATGCPAAETPPCTVSLGALSLHYWFTRNVALTGGLALGFGGGRDGGRALDTYTGFGPLVGMSLLVGNWRHLAVAASPEAGLVWFSAGDAAGTTTTLVTVRGVLEGELHFGFVGLPALSVGLDAGLGFRWVSTGGSRVWSLGVVGPGGISSVLSDLFVRYYL
jgi:hypothetical protein